MARDHEGGVDHLAEAQLLGEVVGAAEERAGGRLAVEERLHAAEQHALAVRELDLVGGHVLLERLDGGVVAARLEADRDRHAGQVGRRLHGRVGGNEDAARGDRVGVGVELGVAARGRHVDRPVAGAGDVGLAALLDRLEGADLAALGVVGAAAGADQLAELVVEALGAEVALLLGDPFLQTEVRLDDELAAHRLLSKFSASAPINVTRKETVEQLRAIGQPFCPLRMPATVRSASAAGAARSE